LTTDAANNSFAIGWQKEEQSTANHYQQQLSAGRWTLSFRSYFHQQ
jgi:hypothetical protein